MVLTEEGFVFDPTELRLTVADAGEVAALLLRPPNARGLLVLGHGAGAGMRHPFLETLSGEFATAGMATLRYQFPYMQRGHRVPDSSGILTATVRAAVRAAAEAAPELPLLAGGKSLGARMTSLAASRAPLERVRGLVFFGFPLHPPERPGTQRAEHLMQVELPMLFLEGTRDSFADLSLLRPVCEKLGARATLHVVETADHSFHVLKRSGKTDPEILHELARMVVDWAETIG